MFLKHSQQENLLGEWGKQNIADFPEGYVFRINLRSKAQVKRHHNKNTLDLDPVRLILKIYPDICSRYVY